MRKPLFFLFTLILSALVNNLHAQQYRWVKGGGSTSSVSFTTAWRPEGTYCSCTDPNGNLYALSVVGNTSILADTFYRSSAYGMNGNVLFSSYTCSGQMRFAKLIAGGTIIPQGVLADNVGNVYLTLDLPHGSSGITVLHIGNDTTVTTSISSREALIQYDTSGNFHWLRFVGSNSAAYSGTGGETSFLALDSSQRAHVISYMRGNVVLSSSVTSQYGTYDLEFDASGNSTNISRIQLDSSLAPGGAIIDKKSGKLYVWGYRSPAFTDSSYHAYLAAFDINRSIIWKDTLADPGYEGVQGFGTVVPDGYGSLYISGSGTASVVFKGDTIRNTLLAGGYAVAFILKADTTGSVKWTRGYSGSSGINFLSRLALLGNKLAAGGNMAGKIKSGADSIVTYSGEGQNSYFTIVDTAGSLFNIQQIHGNGFSDGIVSLTANPPFNFYMGGYVETNTWAGILSPYTSVGGNSDFFLMKYGADCGCTAAPMASFTAVGTHTVNFTYTGTPGSSPLDSVRWFFGDGTSSTVLSPTHVYSTGGTFNACVRVYSQCGGDVECHDIVIPCPYSPVASFTSGGLYTKAFTYTGTTAGVDSIRWKFGDFTTSSLTSPTHTYLAPGTYTACVTAYTWCAWDSACFTFTVPCTSSPVANFTSSGIGATRNFTYTGTSIARDSIRWTFGDGGTSTVVNPSHTYAAIGVYTVCVTFYNPCGSSTICHTVTVNCLAAPVAAYTYTGASNTKAFTYTGTTSGIDSVGWNFGDGWRSTGLTATHTFTSVGTFHVCAKAYSTCGNDTECFDIFVPCITPTVSFTHTAATDSTGHFTYTGSTTNVDSIRWSFGDGTADTGTNTTHHYSTTGIYTVCAVAYSACGNDTLCDTIKIRPLASITESQLASITILPNPVQNELIITNAANCDYTIYNLLGQKLLTGNITGNHHTITVDHIPPAIYLIRLTSPTGEQRSLRLLKE